MQGRQSRDLIRGRYRPFPLVVSPKSAPRSASNGVQSSRSSRPPMFFTGTTGSRPERHLPTYPTNVTQSSTGTGRLFGPPGIDIPTIPQYHEVTMTNETQDLPDRLLEVPEAADFLGLTEKALRRRVEREVIPYRKVGTLLRFDPVELYEWTDPDREEP